jgi:hypothetical protein
MSAAERLAACLRSQDPRPVSPQTLESDICGELERHGVGPLLYRALRDRQWLDAQPAAVRDELKRLHRAEAILEPFRRDETARVLDALSAAGVPALVFKGTALAYTCYDEPSLRPRLDTDLLIRHCDIDAAARIFASLGCTQTLRTSGEYVTHQGTYVSGRNGLNIAFDVHWKVSDPQVFADMFSFEELDEHARALPALAAGARALSDEDALLVACTHRVAHHYDDDMLIFLCDIDLLARRLTPAGWNRVVALATAKQIRQVTLRGLELASRLLETPVPSEVRAALENSKRSLPSSSEEPSAAYLRTGLRKVDILQADLRQLPWRGRIRLIREHLLPPPAFVLQSYGHSRAGLLPFLYLIRIARGAPAWFRSLR